MFPSVLARLTQWACAAVALVLGVAPACALVLCLEPDGSCTLSAAEQGHCVRCPDGCSERQQARSGGDGCCGDELPAVARAVAPPHACACIDIPLPSSDDDRLPPARVQFELGAMLVFAAVVEPGALVPAARERLRPLVAARPPPALDLLRSEILVL